MLKIKNCFRSHGGAAMEIDMQGARNIKKNDLQLYSMLMTESAPPRIESSVTDFRQKQIYSD